jgi:hypothetical protein
MKYANGTFTISKGGFYHLYASVACGSHPSNWCGGAIRINGREVAQSGLTQRGYSMGNTVVYTAVYALLSPGARVDVVARNTAKYNLAIQEAFFGVAFLYY